MYIYPSDTNKDTSSCGMRIFIHNTGKIMVETDYVPRNIFGLQKCTPCKGVKDECELVAIERKKDRDDFIKTLKIILRTALENVKLDLSKDA